MQRSLYLVCLIRLVILISMRFIVRYKKFVLFRNVEHVLNRVHSFRTATSVCSTIQTPNEISKSAVRRKAMCFLLYSKRKQIVFLLLMHTFEMESALSINKVT